MSPVNLENFVMKLLLDASDEGEPLPESPGWVELPDTSLEPHYRRVRAYSDEEDRRDPFVMDWENHNAAYTASMVALLHLRRYWIETSDFLAEKCPEEAVGSMAEDIQHVIENLARFRTELKALEAGEERLSVYTRDAETMVRKSEQAQAAASVALGVAKKTHQGSIWKRDLFRILKEGPVEQLARAGMDNNTTNDKEGA